VEVVGKVQSDLSVKVYQATDFGSDMGTVASSKQHGLGGVANTLRKSDYNAVEAVVDATHRYKEIFYDSND
jgi:replication factor A3